MADGGIEELRGRSVRTAHRERLANSAHLLVATDTGRNQSERVAEFASGKYTKLVSSPHVSWDSVRE